MLTMFTTPRPFRGHFNTIQTNAIWSWLSLRPACEVILFGNDEGTAEIASELGIPHILDVECNEYGTPLVSSMFSIAQNIASHQLMCYVSTDIILMSDFLPAVQRIDKYPFLMVGQRWDLELNESVNFDDAQWEPRLRSLVAKHGELHPPTGIDCFVFPRGLYRNIPPVAAGRVGLDNWLVYWARLLKVPVIDATKAVTAIHQNHGHSHHPGGAETRRIVELMGETYYGFTLEHATWVLTSQGIKRALTPRHLYFRLAALPVIHPHLQFLHKPVMALTRLIIYIRRVLGITRNR